MATKLYKALITITFLHTISILCPITAVAAEVLPDSVESIATTLGFSPSERWRLYQGEIVAVDLPETSDKMLAQMVAMVIPTGIDKVATRLLGGNILETDKDVIAFGRIDPAHIEESLKGALFTKADSDEISRLQNAEFADFNLSSSEIAELKAVGSTTPDTLANSYRKILVARAKAYIGGGLAAIGAYQRDGNKKTNAADDLKKMAAAMVIVAEHDPVLYRAFLNYPKNQPVGIDTEFFWLKKRANNRPVFTLAHRIIQSKPNSVMIMRREFFVGHSFNAAQTVSGLFPLQQGTIIFSGNRTTVDQLSGFASSLRHKIGRNMMREEIVKRFKNLRGTFAK
ncbi:MAG: hypothetical protein PHR16_12460 [Methylovulum sp.]|nr:hypothetical protein [Methylovulum sp.]